MLSRSRTSRLNGFAIARIFVVALLWLALLAGMLPSGALSASHACRMACCAGKPPHEAGACNAALPGAEPAASPSDEAQASDDEQSAHHEQMLMSVTVDQTATDADTHVASGHCETTKRASTQPQAEAAIHPQAAAQAEALVQDSVQAQAAAQHDEAQPRSAHAQQQASIAAGAFTKPCSEECAAAAFAGVQLRRPRPAAVLALALKPRPPTLISRADCFNSLLPSSAARRRQARPRAPPVSLVNPFA